MSGSLFFVFFAARACFAAAVDPMCVAGEAGCASSIDDASSLLATRVERRDGAQWRPLTPAPTPLPYKVGCIQTPQEWADAFNAAKIGCVSPSLFGAVFSNPNGTLFDGRPLAFLSGRSNLENFLSINSFFRGQAEDGTLKPEVAKARISAAFASIVGFPYSAITTLDDPPFTVFAFPTVGATAVVPSWEALFLILEDFGLEKIDFSVTRDLTLAYKKGKDPIASFSEITGCSQDAVENFIAKGPDGSELPDANCWKSFYDAIDATKHPVTPGFGDPPGGVECFLNFWNKVKQDEKKEDGLKANATTFRALFFKCIDASPLFSGVGLGFNNVASPLVPTGPTQGDDRYAGREFVSVNLPVSSLNQVTITLPSTKCLGSEPEGFSFLKPEVGFYHDCKGTPVLPPCH